MGYFCYKKKVILLHLTYLAGVAQRCLGRLGHVQENTLAVALETKTGGGEAHLLAAPPSTYQ